MATVEEIVLSAERPSRADDFADCRFGIVITAKMRHGDLWAATKNLGGLSALARYLSIGPSFLGCWVNLKTAPSFRWLEYTERGRDVVAKLHLLTGKPASELWPSALRAAIKGGKIGCQIERYETVSMQQLAESAASRLVLPSPEDAAMDSETKSTIKDLLRQLTPRLRDIVTRRYGLDGSPPQTLAEVGKVWRITGNRVMQLECRAIHRLQLAANGLPRIVQEELSSYVAGAESSSVE